MKTQYDIPFAREKLIHSILFFTEQITNKTLGTLKMLKLLYLFDFEHFRQTGKPALGLEYEAWKMGPVAPEVYKELSSPQNDLAAFIKIVKRKNDNDEEMKGLEFKAQKKFEKQYFSRREIQIMERITEFCKDLLSQDMTAFTHGRNMPWRKVWNGGKGNKQPINFELSLDAPPIMADKSTITKERLEEVKETDNEFRTIFSDPSGRASSLLEKL